MKSFLKVLMPFVVLALILGFFNVPAKAVDHDHCVCGSKTCSGEGHNKNQNWLPWNDASSLPTSGYYYLTTDVTINYDTQAHTHDDNVINFSNDLNICLNGHVLNISRYLKVTGTGKLTITDCQTSAKHYFKYHKDAAWELDDTYSTGAILWTEIDDTTEENASIEVDGGIFNLPIASGWGFFFENYNSSVLTFNNVNFAGMNAKASLFIKQYDSSKLNMNNCNIIGCETGSSNYFITLCNNGNSAETRHATANIQNCQFQYIVNNGTNYCCLISNEAGDGMTVENCVFKNNKAKLGSIITIGNYGSTSVLNNITIEKNTLSGISMFDSYRNENSEVVLKGKCIIRNNTRNDNPANLCAYSPAVIDTLGLSADSEIYVTVSEEDSVPITVASASSDQTSFFKADNLCYMIKEDTSHNVIVVDRITTQPSNTNNFTVTLKSDDLPAGTSIDYQWEEQSITTSSFKDLSAPNFALGTGTFVTGTNDVSSAYSTYHSVAGYFAEGAAFGGDTVTFSSASELYALVDGEAYGTLTNQFDAATGKYNYTYTFFDADWQCFLVGGDAAFTIEDVKLNVASYSDVSGETSSALVNGTADKTYRCAITIGANTIYTNPIQFSQVGPTPPPTGDFNMTWAFGLLAFVALAAVVVLRVKKNF